MAKRLRLFAADESGAVSTDWIVLSAAIVALAVAVGWQVHNATVGTGQEIGHYIERAANR